MTKPNDIDFLFTFEKGAGGQILNRVRSINNDNIVINGKTFSRLEEQKNNRIDIKSFSFTSISPGEINKFDVTIGDITDQIELRREGKPRVVKLENLIKVYIEDSLTEEEIETNKIKVELLVKICKKLNIQLSLLIIQKINNFVGFVLVNEPQILQSQRMRDPFSFEEKKDDSDDSDDFIIRKPKRVEENDDFVTRRSKKLTPPKFSLDSDSE